MTVSDWWMLLSFYQNVLVVPVAVVLFILLVRAKTVRRRALFATLLLLAWLPHIQVFAGNLYFDYLCRTQAGEFIYRTVDNVDGILQMRPRDGSKDYFDRMAAGDIPEDPWGHTNAEAQAPWFLFRHYTFFEKPTIGVLGPRYSIAKEWDSSLFSEAPADGKFVRFFGYDGLDQRTLKRQFISEPLSTFGYTWTEDRGLGSYLFDIYSGEIRVVHLASEEILGRKKGFLRIRPLRWCSGRKEETFVYDFVSKVLAPVGKTSTSRSAWAR